MAVERLANLTSANKSSRLNLKYIHSFLLIRAMSTCIPPGITDLGKLVETHVGSNDASWQWAPHQKVKLYTNAFIVQNGKVSVPFTFDQHSYIYEDSARVQEAWIWPGHVSFFHCDQFDVLL